MDNITDLFRESKKQSQQFMDDIGSYIGEAIATRINLETSEEDFKIAMEVATTIVNVIASRLKISIDYLDSTNVDVAALSKMFEKILMEDDDGN